MMRYYPMMLVLCLAMLSGCLPQELVVWSPNGQTAAVLNGDALFLCDGDGKLSSEPRVEKVGTVAWMPDSARLVVVRQEPVSTWEQAKPLLSDAQQAAAVAQGEAFMKELLAHQGDISEFQPKVSISTVGLVYVRESYREKLIERVGQEKFDELAVMEAGVWQLQLFDVAGDTLKAGRVLASELSGMAAIRVSPDGKLVAYTAELPAESQSSLALFIIATESDAAPRLVAETVLKSMDFTADGQQLVYARAIAARKLGDDTPPALGELARSSLYSEGALAEEFAKETLATVLFNEEARVRCLKDGRILFSAAEVQLPALADKFSAESGLYMLTGGAEPTLKCILAPKERQGAKPLADVFQVSPDETRVAILYDKGQVGLLPLDGGPMHMILEKTFGERDTLMVPYWRSQVELCMLVPPGSPSGSAERAEVVLWSPEKARCISRDWTDVAFLQGNEQAATAPAEAETQPATQPAE